MYADAEKTSAEPAVHVYGYIRAYLLIGWEEEEEEAFLLFTAKRIADFWHIELYTAYNNHPDLILYKHYCIFVCL